MKQVFHNYIFLRIYILVSNPKYFTDFMDGEGKLYPKTSHLNNSRLC
jgi:hypothetical protein